MSSLTARTSLGYIFHLFFSFDVPSIVFVAIYHSKGFVFLLSVTLK